MNLTPVQSSTLRTVGYEQDGGLLQLEFCRNRAIYQYLAVPSAVHEALLMASSKGSYFNQTIRGRYFFVRLAALQATGEAPDPVAGETRQGDPWHAR